MSTPLQPSTMATPSRQPGLPFLISFIAAGAFSALSGYAFACTLEGQLMWPLATGPAIAALGVGSWAWRRWSLLARPPGPPMVIGVTGRPGQTGPGTARDHGASAPRDARAQQGARLLEAAFDQSGAAMAITDALDRIVMVNPAFVTLSGREPGEVLGQHAELVGMAPLRGTHLPQLDTALREGRRWSGESSLATASGEQQDLWLSVNAIRDAQGRITHHCRVFQDVNPLKEQLRAMAEQARHDSLTGLPNRRAFGEQLFRATARTRRHPRTLALMCVDLDGFKGVNDRHGHQVGDELLVQVARRLQACVRTTDIVCRMGGDEFTLILEAAGAVHDIQRMGQRILTCLSEAYAINGHHIAVTPSIGAVVYDGREADADLVRRADAAMYTAKHQGKGRLIMATTDANGGDSAAAAA